MSNRIRPSRPARARRAAALLALTLLAAGCGGGQETGPSRDGASEVSDQGGDSESGASDEGGAADGGGRSAAAVPADPYPVTPAPEEFEAPAACTGEGAHMAEVGDPAQPELPERAGEALAIELAGIEDDHAQLTATIGSGEARPIEDATIGESVTIDLWTISVTSVCSDRDQVGFDLVN